MFLGLSVFVCLSFVYLSARSLKILWMDFDEIFGEMGVAQGPND